MEVIEAVKVKGKKEISNIVKDFLKSAHASNSAIWTKVRKKSISLKSSFERMSLVGIFN